MKKKILLDTNFLLMPFQFNVDIVTELKRVCDFNYDLYILDKSKDEIKNIIDKQKGKDKAAAKIALLYIEKMKFNTLKAGKDYPEDLTYVDDIILSLEGFIVATSDSELRKQLRKKDVKTIFLKGKTHLDMA